MVSYPSLILTLLSIFSANALSHNPAFRRSHSAINLDVSTPTTSYTNLASNSTSVFSLHSTNPTAVPLSSITSGVANKSSTASLPSTPSPGATPPLKGAPPLPSFVFNNSSGYPPLDQIPATNSDQVQKWIKEVQNSGVSIPNLDASLPGGCTANPGLVANSSRCWWTCGQCTRPKDIVTCPDKMTWGLSYDDGPTPSSADLLNYLSANQLNTTFFIVGSRAISRPEILQAEYLSGHQLSVHTWSHPSMTTLTNEQIIAELGWTKQAIKDITGVTPNTWRPPYGDVDDRVRAIAQAMGLTTIIWSSYKGMNFDTNDWHVPFGFPVVQALNTFEAILGYATSMDTGFIVLEHDMWPQTVDIAVGYVLPDAIARKSLNLQSIIHCLKMPLEDAYIETNNNDTNPPPNSATTGNPSSTSSGSSTTKSHGSAGSMGTQMNLGAVLSACVMTAVGMLGGVLLL